MTPGRPYAPRRPSREAFLDLRGLRHHLREWGPPEGRPLILLHGGRDCSATFQFLVDAFRDERRIIAPDWRGHGLTAWAAEYAFADYLADLDALLDRVVGDTPVPVIGHSLGGNVACVYAGVRPERVSHLVSLDGFGLVERLPEDAPAHLRRWLESWHAAPSETSYPSLEAAAARLRVANPRLDVAQALFLAGHLARPAEQNFAWRFDPRHRAPFATLYRHAEWAACVARITAKILWIGSGAVFPPALAAEPGGFATRLALVPNAVFHRIEGTGHNLHHDAPAALAHLIEGFLPPPD